MKNKRKFSFKRRRNSISLSSPRRSEKNSYPREKKLRNKNTNNLSGSPHRRSPTAIGPSLRLRHQHVFEFTNLGTGNERIACRTQVHTRTIRSTLIKIARGCSPPLLYLVHDHVTWSSGEGSKS